MRTGIGVPIMRDVQRSKQDMKITNCAAPLGIRVAIIHPNCQLLPSLHIIHEPDRIVLIIVSLIAEFRDRTISTAKRRTMRAEDAENLWMCECVCQCALATR